MDRVLIVGAGGHGRSVAEAVLLGGKHRIAGFVDDGWPGLNNVWGYPVFGRISTVAECMNNADVIIVAIGNNATRERLHATIMTEGIPFATVVHPNAVVSPRATLGAGCVVMAGAVIGAESVLGEGVIVNCGAVVDHHCRVDAFGHLGVGACMAGGATLGRGAWLQAGVALAGGVNVGAGAVLISATAFPGKEGQ